jgi:hypothetical protein
MDRLLRLLPKKHSAFNEFAHQFSETLFIRDKDDEANVRRVLEAKKIKWDYAVRAMKAMLNRRIRRYIPPPERLAADLEILFNSFQDIQDSVDRANGRGCFFSKESRKTAANLLETVRLGFISDPPGISLYYIRGKDRDGLTLFRKIAGTNSVEGSVHMLIRRIFDPIRASPELTEAIVGNWMHRQVKIYLLACPSMLLIGLILKIGHYNRTGKKWLSHYDIWLLDELVEKALLLGIEPSISMPRLLATRIATSESSGIIPIGSSIAKEVEIPLLPSLNLHTVPHHNDLPSQALTRLSTKPCNIYRYIQLRQRTPVPVIPVHNFAEYKFLKSNVDTFRITALCGTTGVVCFFLFWQVFMRTAALSSILNCFPSK